AGGHHLDATEGTDMGLAPAGADQHQLSAATACQGRPAVVEVRLLADDGQRLDLGRWGPPHPAARRQQCPQRQAACSGEGLAARGLLRHFRSPVCWRAGSVSDRSVLTPVANAPGSPDGLRSLTLPARRVSDIVPPRSRDAITMPVSVDTTDRK